MVARAVYANYGTPDDFIELERNRVNVSGMVVIARYGKCFRGLKAMNAQRRGAAAVLLYSDPQDDGYSVGPTYPDGPWRPKTSGIISIKKCRMNSLTGLVLLCNCGCSATGERTVLKSVRRRSEPCME